MYNTKVAHFRESKGTKEIWISHLDIICSTSLSAVSHQCSRTEDWSIQLPPLVTVYLAARIIVLSPWSWGRKQDTGRKSMNRRRRKGWKGGGKKLAHDRVGCFFMGDTVAVRRETTLWLWQEPSCSSRIDNLRMMRFHDVYQRQYPLCIHRDSISLPRRDTPSFAHPFHVATPYHYKITQWNWLGSTWIQPAAISFSGLWSLGQISIKPPGPPCTQNAAYNQP